MRLCLAETGSVWMVDTRMNVDLRSVTVALGEAELAAIQTVHFAASVALEWWCAANATADQSVISRHNHAMCFEIDRTTRSDYDYPIYNEFEDECNKSPHTRISCRHESAHTLVTASKAWTDSR